ncbi:hypothetical protein C8J57DRAFT_1495350 [Mycena rebaudengoi]|nr:hypothetical protein C8J57DRAFT_1495350 [Mycena rebaudengoi]
MQYSMVPRIVVVASEVHYWVEMDKKTCEKRGEIFKTLGSAAYCTPKVMRGRYFLSKLINILFIRALNARLDASTPLTVNTVNLRALFSCPPSL